MNQYLESNESESVHQNPIIFILSPDQIFQQQAQTQFVDLPQVETVLVNSIHLFWQKLSSTVCDLLILDDRILPSGDDSFLNGLRNLATPVALIEFNAETRVWEENTTRFIKKISPGEISSLDARELLIQAKIPGYCSLSSVDLSGSSIPMLWWDHKGILQQISQGLEELLGSNITHFIGRHIDEGFFTLFSPAFTFNDAFCTGREVELALNGSTNHERCFSFKFSEMTLNLSGQSAVGFMAIVREITEHDQVSLAQQERQDFNERVLQENPNIIFIWNVSRREFSFVNNAASEILGYAPDEIVSMKPEDWEFILSADKLGTVLNHFRGFSEKKDRGIVQNEYYLRDKENKWRCFRSRETVFEKNPDGTAQSILGTLVEITELRHIQDRLEKRLRREELFASMAMDFLYIDPKQYDVRIDEAINRVRMLIGCSELVLYEYDGSLLNKIHEVTASGNPSTHPEVIMTENNPICKEYLETKKPFLIEPGMDIEPHFRQTFSQIFSESLSMAAIFPLTFQDSFIGAVLFTPMGKSLHWSSFEISVAHTFATILSGVLHNAKTNRTVNSANTPWWGTDPTLTKLICQFNQNHVITYVNDAMCEIMGKTKEELLGKRIEQFSSPSEQNFIQKMLDTMNKDNLVITMERDWFRPDGRKYHLDWVFRGFLDENEQIKEFQAIGRDITGINEEQGEFTTEQTHLVHTARLRSIGELATGVAHQISNPLTTIIAEAQILTHELTPDHPARESADAILEAGWQAQDVIQVLKQISEIKSGREETFSVNDTIASALSLTSEYLQSVNVGIFTDFERGIPDVTGNSRDIIDLWVNFLLLVHSAARTSRVNQVEIFTRFISPDWVEIVFQNNGKVFSNENQETLYEPQAIPDPAKMINGFELLICREIINRHQGTLNIESSDLSTIFQVRLPKG